MVRMDKNTLLFPTICKVALLLKAVLFTAAPCWADLTIFDVRKNLALSDTDPVYRDFYVSGGTEEGLAVGMLITVQRRVPLYDTYQNRSAGDLQLKVARVKIIHVQKGLAVARLQSEFTRENAPLLEDNFILIGDRLDLASAATPSEERKSGGSGKRAELDEDPTANPTSASAAISTPESVQERTTAQVTTPTEPAVTPAAAPGVTPPTPNQQKVDAPVLQ